MKIKVKVKLKINELQIEIIKWCAEQVYKEAAIFTPVEQCDAWVITHRGIKEYHEDVEEDIECNSFAGC